MGGNGQQSQATDPDADVKVGPMGFVQTPARKAELLLAMMKGAGKASEVIKGFQNADTKLAEDARNRIKKPFEDYRKIRVAHDKVSTGLARKDGPGDLQAVTTLQRMIDDGIVRKEDMDNWASTVGIAETWGVFFKRAEKGDRLADPTRAKLKSLAGDLMMAKHGEFATFIGIQKELARNNNVPWGRVYGKASQKYLDGAIGGKAKTPDKGRFKKQ